MATLFKVEKKAAKKSNPVALWEAHVKRQKFRFDVKLLKWFVTASLLWLGFLLKELVLLMLFEQFKVF